MLTATCPNPTCKLEGQHIGMLCAFCGTLIPTPAGMNAADGTLATVKEVIGWRGWKIARNADGEPRLNSPLFPLTWEPGEVMVATCRTTRTDDRATVEYHGPGAIDLPDERPGMRISPVKGCGGGGHGCGFYAGRTRAHLTQHLGYARYTEDDPSVIGEVQMAGKIIMATNGYRAERVWPVRIYVPYEFWRLQVELDAAYGPHGVEVLLETTIINPSTTAPEWCPKCTFAKLDRSGECPLCHYKHI